MKILLRLSRKLLFAMVLIVVPYTSFSQLTYVPDGYFENALINLGLDDVEDNYVLTSNISGLIVLDVSGSSISNLTGIEDFVSLQNLNCGYNNLSSLDITNNTDLIELDCSGNNLTSLNTSSNTFLSSLSCNLNDITSLDLSSNTELSYLSCYSNDLTVLDLSNNTSLTYLSCNYNGLTNLDLSNNTALDHLSCYANSLNLINVTNCTMLTALHCDNNSLTSIDISNNTLLEHLSIHTNNLAQLDTSNNILLEDITCHENNISDLDLSNNTQLWFLWCYDNNLSDLDLSNNPLLYELRCQFNNITSLDLSNNPALTFARCHNNNLSYFDIKNGTNDIITYISVLNNPELYCIQVDDVTYSNTYWLNLDAQSYYSEDCFSTVTYIPDDAFEQTLIDLGYDDTLDNYVLKTNINTVTFLYVAFEGIDDLTGIEGFTALTTLSCDNNNLTKLDVSSNLALTDLYCYSNNIMTLDVSANTALKAIGCSNNNLSSLNVKNGNNTNFTFFNALNNPNLFCIEVDDALYSLANWSNIDAQSYFDTNCSLSVVQEALPEVKMYPNPVRDVLTLELNNLVQLDEISVYTISGVLVMKTDQSVINLESLSSGFYIMQIKTNRGIATKKLIKK